MKKTVLFTILSLLMCYNSSAHTTVRDSLVEVIKKPQPTEDHFRVVTNRFWDNWFVLGDIGEYAYFGDYAGMGKFSGRLSPHFNFGIGKWFTPGIGVKLQFGGFRSKSYSAIKTWYTYGDPLTTANGEQYWKSKMKWWDFNVNAMFNLSRLFYGYEDIGTDKLFNQFILSAGIGTVHHWDTKGAQRNEWEGRLELQYSRFFNKEKSFSLDVKARGIFFQTNFDAIVLKPNGKHSRWWDANLGISVGVTYYFKKRGWERCVACSSPVYINVPAPIVVPEKCPEYRTFTFYIFYPNNYSGRNDSPIVKGAPVHSMDYLAAGIFTQKKFTDNSKVASRLLAGNPLSSLHTADVSTEKATVADTTGLFCGYEMSSTPISLSMDPDSLKCFETKAGYYYAPIYDGKHTWYYRIDNETKGQSLLRNENYKENISYGLNAHTGLGTVRENMRVEAKCDLYSFADVYAALNGNEGYISHFTDSNTVKEIKHILKEGNIFHVQAEGLATSQDNYTGKDAENVGLTRNKALAYNRALSAIKWLKESGKFEDVAEDNFVINALSNPIGIVNDQSTQGLNAKLNRCVRIRVQYMIKP